MKVTKYRRIRAIKQEDCIEPRLFTIIGADEVNFSRSAGKPEYKIRITIEDDLDKFTRPLNEANLETIASEFGDETDDWLEQEIIGVADPDIEFDGQKVGGIKIEIPKKRPASKHARAAKNEEEIPFGN